MATLVEWLILRLSGAHVALLVLFTPIALMAWRGGLRPGLFATALALLALLSPLHSEPALHKAIEASFLAAAGLLASVLLPAAAAFRRRTEATAEARPLLETLDETQRALRQSRQWLAGVSEGIADAFLAVDRSESVVWANRKAEQLFGRSREQLLGRPMGDVLPESKHSRLYAEARRALAQKMPVYIEQPCPSLGLWLEVHLYPAEEGLCIYAQDITERKRAEEERTRLAAGERHARNELQKAMEAPWDIEARFRCLVESNIIGIIVQDREKILDANDAFLQLVGRTREDLVAGRLRLEALTAPEHRPADEQRLQELLIRGPAAPYEKEYVRSDGTRVPALIGLAVLEKSPEAWIGIVLDLTERKRIEQQIQQACQKAEADDRAKDHFLAVLSHELRMPLAPVVAAISELEHRSDLPTGIAEDLVMIRRNVEVEVRLIDDLLDLVKVTRGKLQLNPAGVDAHEQIGYAVETCRSEAQRKQVQLVLELSAEEHHVRADPARLQQIFWNLVKNAVKFTPAGGRVTVRTSNGGQRERDNGQQGGAGELEPRRAPLIVEVSDTGIGITPEDLPRIFNAFEQAVSAPGNHLGGLGLGLTITKGLVEAHGGRITAASEGRSRGATFAVELPTVPASEAAAPAPPPQVRAEPGTQLALRVLLIEDHPDTARMMSRLLTSLNCDVRIADSVQSALRAAEEGDLDLIISDLGLPDGSGLDLMRRLRAMYNVKGIAISGYGQEEDIRRSREAGFLDHLTKPVDIEKLEAALRIAGVN